MFNKLDIKDSINLCINVNDVLLDSSKWYPYFPYKQLRRIFLILSILERLQWVTNSYNLTTKQITF